MRLLREKKKNVAKIYLLFIVVARSDTSICQLEIADGSLELVVGYFLREAEKLARTTRD